MGLRVHEYSGIRSRVSSGLGSSCRTPLPVAHRYSCFGKSPAGNRPDTHTCTRHECWHTPRVGNAHLWRTHPHLQESRKFLARKGLRPQQPRLPPLPGLTYAGPINPLEASWTWSIWAIHWVGVPCGERRGRGRERLAGDNQAALKKD